MTLPTEFEPPARMTLHLCDAAVHADFGSLWVVCLARPADNCPLAIMACHVSVCHLTLELIDALTLYHL